MEGFYVHVRSFDKESITACCDFNITVQFSFNLIIRLYSTIFIPCGTVVKSLGRVVGGLLIRLDEFKSHQGAVVSLILYSQVLVGSRNRFQHDRLN